MMIVMPWIAKATGMDDQRKREPVSTSAAAAGRD